ncbi:IS30 family transposase [Sphingomonas zeicaulis]
MKQQQRTHYSAAQRAEIWDPWQRGESMSSIGRHIDRQSSSIFSVLSRSGGIRPVERGRSVRALAALLGRAPSTISREIGRNGGRDAYRATVSDQAAWERGRRPKLCKLACQPALRRTVSAKLRRKWSPEQIAGWLRRSFPDEERHRVSHETIYKSLYIQARGVLKKELLEHLRARRTIRRSRHASLKRDGLGQIKDAISISERPAAVEGRAVPGHWGGVISSCGLETVTS